MANEESVFKWGGIDFPLTAATTNSLLRDADPALYWALLFWQSVLNTHLQARLLAQVALMTGIPITAAVKDTAHFDPGPYLLDNPEIRFPLLAAYRVDGVFEERTVTWDHEVSNWEVAYVLPVLHWQGARSLLPILNAVGKVLVNRTNQAHDPAYGSGVNVWGSTRAYVESIDFTGYRRMTYSDGESMTFEAWIGRCRVKERVMPPVAGTYDDMSDVDTNLDNAATGETTVSNVVQTRTDTDP